MPAPAVLLAALTPTETQDFLPEPLLSEVRALTPDFRSLSTVGLSATDFQHALAAANPEVLVAAWNTPALPPELPPRLRYVCYLCGSVKHLVTRAHLESGLLLTNWGDAISRTVAEAALLHVLSCLRRTTHWTLAMHQEGAWKTDDRESTSLFERRIGLHGFGRVARELVKLLRPFNPTLSVFSPDVTPAVAAEWGVSPVTSLETLFAENDIIVEVAPLLPATRGIVQERHLRLIRPGGAFVNVGRGAVVDEAGLIRVAQEGRVQFGLDVFATEPLPAAHPLRGLRNVSLTPHVAGPTAERRRDAGTYAMRNLRAYVAGQPLQGIVTTHVYDTAT
ncbi:MAG: hydroxyacid dehydrogenase [Opitutae bacterium]|nr:hydroxyacid dehydrogenase [Opitutae bacterium]